MKVLLGAECYVLAKWARMALRLACLHKVPTKVIILPQRFVGSDIMGLETVMSPRSETGNLTSFSNPMARK